MAKVQIKSEKLTPFGGIFSIMEQFDCSFIIEKIPPKGVSFSDFICTFAMSFRVLFVFYLQH